MFGLNAFALLVCLSCVWSAVWVCRMDASRSQRILRRICWTLLLVSLGHWAISGWLSGQFVLPIEFSTLSYFMVPLALLLGRGRSWAAYAGMLAGSVYALGMVAAGARLFAQTPVWSLYLAMARHGMLLVCGVVAAARESFDPRNAWKLVLGMAGMGLWAVVMRPLSGQGPLLIYILLDGAGSGSVLGGSLAVRAGYYIVLLGLVWGSVRIFFCWNRWLYERFAVERTEIPANRRQITHTLTQSGKI